MQQASIDLGPSTGSDGVGAPAPDLRSCGTNSPKPDQNQLTFRVEADALNSGVSSGVKPIIRASFEM